MSKQSTAVATTPGPSILIAMADRYGMQAPAFEATLRATVVPKDCTREQFAAFLLVAHEYGLNPMTKEIFAFPTKGGGIQPVVSVDGWLALANRHPMMNGLEFDDHIDGDGELTAITARIWRKDREHPIVVTEYMEECARNTEPWQQWPRRMLRHKSVIQCARYAFGYSGIIEPDEAERMGIDVSPLSSGIGGGRVSATKNVSPPAAPKRVTTELRDPPSSGWREDQEPNGGEAAGGEAAPAGGEREADQATETAPATEGDQATSAAPAAPAFGKAEIARLKVFASDLANQVSEASIARITGRFWSDNDLGDDDERQLAVRARAIVDAQRKRARGEVSISDTDAAVKKALTL